MDKKALKLYIENLINRGSSPAELARRSSVPENMERMTTTWQPR